MFDICVDVCLMCVYACLCAFLYVFLGKPMPANYIDLLLDNVKKNKKGKLKEDGEKKLRKNEREEDQSKGKGTDENKEMKTPINKGGGKGNKLSSSAQKKASAAKSKVLPPESVSRHQYII